MRTRLNREIKSFCKDFRRIRKILKEIGATLISQTEQVDYFFFLPDSPGKARARRLKLRIDDGEPRLIYYFDRTQPCARSVEFQVFPVTDPGIKDVLEAALGVRTVVRKRREVWEKGGATFNLDTVYGVGKVFEVELQAHEGDDAAEQVAHYRNLFSPYLEEEIQGSNEDLVAPFGRA